VPEPFETTSPEQTVGLGATLGALLQAGDVVLLTGDLGAGKTQFTKGVARALGVRTPVTSPTFNLMYEYATDRGTLLRHFDLYRLDDEAQLDDIDYFGLLEDGSISLVEWGDRFPDALPPDCLTVAFELVGTQLRRLRLDAQGARGAQLLAAFGEAAADGD
jgi:tRNA threonylcarbamoyladenosine biosynthesis protein TsaE